MEKDGVVQESSGILLGTCYRQNSFKYYATHKSRRWIKINEKSCFCFYQNPIFFQNLAHHNHILCRQFQVDRIDDAAVRKGEKSSQDSRVLRRGAGEGRRLVEKVGETQS